MQDTIMLPSMVEIRKSRETEHYTRFVVINGPGFVPNSKLIDDLEHMRSLGFKVISFNRGPFDNGQFICEKVTP